MSELFSDKKGLAIHLKHHSDIDSPFPEGEKDVKEEDVKVGRGRRKKSF